MNNAEHQRKHRQKLSEIKRAAWSDVTVSWKVHKRGDLGIYFEVVAYCRDFGYWKLRRYYSHPSGRHYEKILYVSDAAFRAKWLPLMGDDV